MKNSKSDKNEPRVLVTGEELLAVLKERYADIYEPLTMEKTPWQHGVRVGVSQVIRDIEGLLE